MKYLVVYVTGNNDRDSYAETHTAEYYSVERLVEGMIYKWKSSYRKDLYIESIYIIKDEEEDYDFETERNKHIRELFNAAKSNIIKEEEMKKKEKQAKEKILEEVKEKELYIKLKEKFKGR